MKRLFTGFILLALAITTQAEDSAAENWNKVYQVFSHPRCANCHVGDDNIPRWSGEHYGDTRLHGMNINAGPSRIGAKSVLCSTCHTQHNSPKMHGAPGAEVWMLAPVEMQWWNKSSGEVCRQIKDPERNGGRTLQEVADHISRDELVHWGWEPGPGREPAPYSARELTSFFEQWAAAGAPCPEDA